MPSIVIDAAACSGDGLCVKSCTKHFLEIHDGKAGISRTPSRGCNFCGACIAVCPKKAISIDGKPLPAIRGIVNIPEDQLSYLLATRRSIRNFKKTPVPEDVLAKALDLANYAPTAGNKHQVRWAVITRPELLRELVRETVDFISQDTSYPHIPRYYAQGLDPIFWGAPCLVLNFSDAANFMTPHDCSAALTYLELALHGMGLGSCWAGNLIRAGEARPELKAMMGIPEGDMLVGGLMVGYPEFRTPQAPPRPEIQLAWIR